MDKLKCKHFCAKSPSILLCNSKLHICIDGSSLFILVIGAAIFVLGLVGPYMNRKKVCPYSWYIILFTIFEYANVVPVRTCPVLLSYRLSSLQFHSNRTYSRNVLFMLSPFQYLTCSTSCFPTKSKLSNDSKNDKLIHFVKWCREGRFCFAKPSSGSWSNNVLSWDCLYQTGLVSGIVRILASKTASAIMRWKSLIYCQRERKFLCI